MCVVVKRSRHKQEINKILISFIYLFLKGLKNICADWFLCLMAYQLFLGYLMPKPFSYKNSSGTI